MKIRVYNPTKYMISKPYPLRPGWIAPNGSIIVDETSVAVVRGWFETAAQPGVWVEVTEADSGAAESTTARLPTPVAATDAATKGYVDSSVTGLDTKNSVRLVTIAALPAYTRTGNVLLADANGALPDIDGVAPAVGNRVLLKNGAAGADNGIHAVDSLGGAGSKWQMTRATDADASAEVTSGMYCEVEEGSQAGTGWYLSTANPIVLNTTALTFTQWTGPVNRVDGTITTVNAGDVAVAGTSPKTAAADHEHAVSTAAAIELTDATNAEGIAGTLARSDHEHSHGARAGGALHAAAQTVGGGGAAGFLTAAEKDANALVVVEAVRDGDFAGAALGRMTRTGAGTYVVVQDNLAAATAPLVTDDTAAGYAVGSLWIDTALKRVWACVDATAGAAVWVLGHARSSLEAGVAPTVNDDVTLGYKAGSLWLNSVTAMAYVCVDATDGAAVWVRLRPSSAAADPGVGDDSTAGFVAGSEWTNTAAVPVRVWICRSAAAGAASWVKHARLTREGAGGPEVTSDASGGYDIGSTWHDTTADLWYVCLDATVGAAKWLGLGARPWGDGADGDATIAAPTSLDRNREYGVLTVNDVLSLAGFILRADTVSVSATGTVSVAGAAGTAGGNGDPGGAGGGAGGSAGAAGAAAYTGAYLADTVAGKAGQIGGVGATAGGPGAGAGVAGTAGTAVAQSVSAAEGATVDSGVGGNGGAGGGGGGAAAAGGALATATGLTHVEGRVRSPSTYTVGYALGGGATVPLRGGTAGGGGASGGGGGDGGGAIDGGGGGGSGGSGSPGGLGIIIARRVAIAAGGTITAAGGAGGNGGAGGAGEAGGGAGGGGGGGGGGATGGCLVVAYGVEYTNAGTVTAAGGAGGALGAGGATGGGGVGADGTAGAAGAAGRVIAIAL